MYCSWCTLGAGGAYRSPTSFPGILGSTGCRGLVPKPLNLSELHQLLVSLQGCACTSQCASLRTAVVELTPVAKSCLTYTQQASSLNSAVGKRCLSANERLKGADGRRLIVSKKPDLLALSESEISRDNQHAKQICLANTGKA